MQNIDYTKYSSISATDIQLVMNGVIIGSVQNLTYSEQRQKVPIYTFGSTDPRQFLRGNRIVNGRIGGVQLVPDSFIEAIAKTISDFMSGKESAGIVLFPRDKYLYQDRDAIVAKYINIARKLGLPTSGEYWRTYNLDTGMITVQYDKTVPIFLNELPPFDMLIQGMNEYGKKATKWIYGCEITDEGISIDMSGTTQVLESLQFIARTSSPWQEVTD